MTLSISVVLPAYNEEDNLEKVVSAAVAILRDLSAEGLISDCFEVLICDDGSTDETGTIADELSTLDSHVRAIHHETNRGWGGALRTLFDNAICDWIFLAPADNQQDMSELRLFVDAMEGFDIVAGYRIKRVDPWMRRLTGEVRRRLICRMFGLNLRDLTWCKLFRREVFDEIELDATSAFIDDEILIRASKKGFAITETGVHHHPRTAGVPTGNNPIVMLRAFRDLLLLWNKLRSEPTQPMRERLQAPGGQ